MADADDIWAAKSDEELRQAATDLGEYTEEGERVIRAELQRRRLPPPDPPIGRCSRCGRSIFPGSRREECPQCGEPFPREVKQAIGARGPEVALVPVLRTADAGLMAFAQSLLENEGIENSVRGENVQDLFGVGRLGGYNLITGPAELWVRADDEERARKLLDELSEMPAEPSAEPNNDA
jgi:hypothetical protein